MNITRTFFYWAYKNKELLDYIGDNRYIVEKSDLLIFQKTLTELVKTKSASKAKKELPPIPMRKIDDEYWSDLESTKQELDIIIETMPEDAIIYYIGNI